MENIANCEKTLSALVEEWNRMVHLNNLVREDTRYSSVVINVQSYKYHNIVLRAWPRSSSEVPEQTVQ